MQTSLCDGDVLGTGIWNKIWKLEINEMAEEGMVEAGGVSTAAPTGPKTLRNQ